MVETLNCLGGLHTEEDFKLQETIFSSTISNITKNLKFINAHLKTWYNCFNDDGN